MPARLAVQADGDDPPASSPLARLFAPRLQATRSESAAVEHAEIAVKKVEALLDDMRELPVQKLKEEMKEVQVRDVLFGWVVRLGLSAMLFHRIARRASRVCC